MGLFITTFYVELSILCNDCLNLIKNVWWDRLIERLFKSIYLEFFVSKIISLQVENYTIVEKAKLTSKLSPKNVFYRLGSWGGINKNSSYFERCALWWGLVYLLKPNFVALRHPRACTIKLITAVIYGFLNKLECLFLASLPSLAWCFQVRPETTCVKHISGAPL